MITIGSIEQRLPGAGGGSDGEVPFHGTEFPFCKMKGALERLEGCGLQSVNALDVTAPDKRAKIYDEMKE